MKATGELNTSKNTNNDSWDDLKNVDFAGNKKLKNNYDKEMVDRFGRDKLISALNNTEHLKKVSKSYLEQYNPGAQTIANTIIGKKALDNFVVERLSSEHPEMFIKSKEFKNYSDYIMQIADQKKFKSKNGDICLYPEYFTNPVFKDKNMRELVFKTAYPNTDIDKINHWFDTHEAEYNGTIKYFVENGIEKRQQLSQKQMDIIGDYIYAGENYDDGIAKKYAEYCFNEIKDDSKVKPSVPMLGALTNYFAKCYTNDEEVNRKSRIIIASHTNGDPNSNFHIGASTSNFIALEKEHFLEMSLTSDKSLNKSRTDKENDIYRLMMISFHELTHNHQKNMVKKGEKNSSAMSYILNKVLNRGNLKCYEKTKADGTVIKGSYYEANHDSDEIEIQADEESWMQCRHFLAEHQELYAQTHKDKELEKKYTERWTKCLDNRIEVSARRIFTKKLAETNEKVSSVQYDIENLKTYVKNDPNLLETYTQLKDYIDKDGSLKLDILFNKKIANVNYEGMDERTDVFGVEIGTYLLTKDIEVNRVANYVQNNELSQEQAKRLMFNLWNIVHQNALKSRALKNINFENYDETHAYGKDQSLEELHNNILEQYIKQCYNCIRVAELVSSKHPELRELISREEDTQIGFYYQELAENGKLDLNFAKKAVDAYNKTNCPTLKRIASTIEQSYSL